jgi:hypothetical protein
MTDRLRARRLLLAAQVLYCVCLFHAVITPASASTYYVSSFGRDTNNGLSPWTPWQTTAKVNATTFQPGDNILFRGGDTFDGPIILVGPNTGAPQQVFSTPAQPVILGGYGSNCNILAGVLAGCPRLSVTGTTPGGIVINNLSGVLVRDWILTGADPMTQNEGIYLRNNDASGTVYQSVTVTNASITGFRSGILVQGSVKGAGWQQFTISNNHVFGTVGSEDNGILVQGSQPGTPGVMTNFDCLIEGNLVEAIPGRPNAVPGTSGNGILIKETDGCVSQFNVVRNSGANATTCGGPVGNWAYDATHILFRFNETYGMAPATWVTGCDWGGFDLDGYVTHSKIEYNYAHDNWGAGFLLWITGPGTWDHNVIRYNISENNALNQHAAQYFGGIVLANSNTSLVETYVYNNTIYSANTPYPTILLAVQGDLGGDCIIANNILQSAGKPWFVYTGTARSASCLLVGNNYYAPLGFLIKWNVNVYLSLDGFRSATGQEMVANSPTGSVSNPGLSAPGSGATCQTLTPPQTCPDAYQLSPGSPMIGTGIDLRRQYGINVGSHDYFGNRIPHGLGTGFNVGADGGPHLNDAPPHAHGRP